MVERTSKTNNRNNNSKSKNIPLLTLNSDSPADDLIKILSEKLENRRAKQTWEWEQVRRNSSGFRDAA